MGAEEKDTTSTPPLNGANKSFGRKAYAAAFRCCAYVPCEKLHTCLLASAYSQAAHGLQPYFKWFGGRYSKGTVSVFCYICVGVYGRGFVNLYTFSGYSVHKSFKSDQVRGYPSLPILFCTFVFQFRRS